MARTLSIKRTNLRLQNDRRRAFALELLVAAGCVKRKKVSEAMKIARRFKGGHL